MDAKKTDDDFSLFKCLGEIVAKMQGAFNQVDASKFLLTCGVDGA